MTENIEKCLLHCPAPKVTSYSVLFCLTISPGPQGLSQRIYGTFARKIEMVATYFCNKLINILVLLCCIPANHILNVSMLIMIGDGTVVQWLVS